ncbi:MAG: hypothetical protein ACLFPE_14850, partial [Bacteroidales bacterium]
MKKSMVSAIVLLQVIFLSLGIYTAKAQEANRPPFTNIAPVYHSDNIHGEQQIQFNDSYTKGFRTELLARYADGVAQSAATHENIAFISQGSMIKIMDISDFGNPEEISTLILPSPAVEVKLVDNNLMLAVYKVGLMIYDVSDLTAPFLKGEYNLWEDYGTTVDLDVEANVAYLGGASGVISLDVSDPSNIGFMQHIYDSTMVYTLCVQNGIVYFDCPPLNCYKGYSGTTQVWNVQLNSSSMGFGISSFGQHIFYGRSRGLTAYNTTSQQANTVYFANDEYVMDVSDCSGGFLVVGTCTNTLPSVSGLKLIDISDPDQMIVTGEYQTEGEGFNHVNLYNNSHGRTAILPVFNNGTRFLKADESGLSELGYTPSGDQYRHIAILDDQHFYSINSFSMELFAVNLPSILRLNDWWFGNYSGAVVTHNYPDNPYLYM